MRHERRSHTMPALAEDLDEMVAVIERNRGQRADTNGERKLHGAVTVMVWEEPDGSETVTVVGNSEMTPLQMKGILHDGLFTLAHEDDHVPTH